MVWEGYTWIVKRVCLQLFLSLLLCVISYAQPSSEVVPPVSILGSDPMAALNNKESLSYGDVINYRVIEDRDETKKLTVTESGEVNVPYFGSVKALGKTCFQLAADIKPLLEKNLYNRATVLISLEETQKGKVYVVGAVGRPGPVEISPVEKLTVSKAILAAGGFVQFSNKGKVKVVRKTGEGPKDRKEFVVDAGAVLEKGQLDKDLVVEGGDMIIVSEKLINF